MRSVVHPGPVSGTRLELAPAQGREIEVTLEPGVPFDEAVAGAVAAEGVDSAWLEIKNAPVSALDYVIPAPSPDDAHVAWYSEVHSFGGKGLIDHLGFIVGIHEGTPFLHGHGLWTPEGGARAMGHILPDRTVLAAPATARGTGITGARFERLHDPETNFDLFRVKGGKAEGAGYAALRLLPNQDFATALEGACAELGWKAARVQGLGSLIGATFEGGEVLDSLATEFLVTDATTGGGPEPEIAIVGVDGSRILSGRLARGENAVLITAELVLSRTG